MTQEFVLSSGMLPIPCKLNVPDDGDIRRVVIGVHGLGGCTTDDIQTSLAQEMEDFYSAVLRFDFPVHGESPLESDDFTLDNCVDSLLAVANKAKSLFPSVEDLCIFATGFGAYVTLIAMDELVELPGNVKLVVQTPSVLMHKTLLAMKNMTLPTLRAMGCMDFNRKRYLRISYHFYKTLEENIALASYPIPILILQGEEDKYIQMEDITNFRRLNERAKLVIIPGTSHRFLEDGAWDMVLDLTRDWFTCEQVLLADYI